LPRPRDVADIAANCAAVAKEADSGTPATVGILENSASVAHSLATLAPVAPIDPIIDKLFPPRDKFPPARLNVFKLCVSVMWFVPFKKSIIPPLPLKENVGDVF
jgi:hypothetical protein